MKLINLTPHTITVHSPDGSTATLPSEGLARVPDVRGEPDADGVATLCLDVGAVTGLPRQADGVSYVVSLLTAMSLDAGMMGRDDLLVAGPAIRDDAGRIVGCKGLSRLAPVSCCDIRPVWTKATNEPDSVGATWRLDGGVFVGGVSLTDLGGDKMEVRGMAGRGFGRYFIGRNFAYSHYTHIFEMPFDEAQALIERAHDELPPIPPRSGGMRKAIFAGDNSVGTVEVTAAEIVDSVRAMSGEPSNPAAAIQLETGLGNNACAALVGVPQGKWSEYRRGLTSPTVRTVEGWLVRLKATGHAITIEWAAGACAARGWRLSS